MKTLIEFLKNEKSLRNGKESVKVDIQRIMSNVKMTEIEMDILKNNARPFRMGRMSWDMVNVDSALKSLEDAKQNNNDNSNKEKTKENSVKKSNIQKEKEKESKKTDSEKKVTTPKEKATPPKKEVTTPKKVDKPSIN